MAICDAKQMTSFRNCTIFLSQIDNAGRPVMTICKYKGGELARLIEFFAIITNNHQDGLKMTAGYLSWLNGKAEHPIQTVSNMTRAGYFDHGLGPQF